MLNFKLAEKIPIQKFLSTKIIDNFQNVFNLDPNSADYHIRSSFIIFLITFIMYVLYTIKSNLIPAVLFSIVVSLLYYLNYDKINEYIDLSKISNYIKNFLKNFNLPDLSKINLSNFTNMDNNINSNNINSNNNNNNSKNYNSKNNSKLNIKNQIKKIPNMLPNKKTLDKKNKNLSNDLKKSLGSFKKNKMNKMNKIK